MFDAHNHLHFEAFDEDRDETIARARAAGVGGMVLAGYDSRRRDVAAALTLTPDIHAAAGLHPWAVRAATVDEELALLQDLDWSPFCAVGELGLDWVRATSETDRNLQVRVFRAQLALARDLELPIVIHCVQANDDVAKWLRLDGTSPQGGMVHSFWGSEQQADAFLKLGLHLSIGTQLTHSQPPRVLGAIRRAGLARLLAETDAPSRPPRGVHKQRNEPAFLAHVIDAMAAVLDEDPNVVADATEQNAKTLFA